MSRSGSTPIRSRASLYVPANALVLVWFAAAAIVTIAHRFVPGAGWLMVHLLLLGGVSTAILLWSQHFAETLLRRPAPGGRPVVWVRLLGWSAGAAMVTGGMVVESTVLVVAGAALLVAISVLHVAVLVRQRGGGSRSLGNRYAHLVRYYLLATGMLPVGVALGVVLARLSVSPEVAGRLYVAHVTTTMLGWIGMTVAGTIVLLWPTVLHTRISPAADDAGRRALWLMLGGMVTMLAGPATGQRLLVAVGALVVAAAVLLLGVHATTQLRAAIRAQTGGSFAAASIGASLLWLLGCVIAFGAVVGLAPSWTAVPDRLTGLVAPFAVGFVAQVMIGSMTYLLPVVLGGGPAAVRWSIANLEIGAATRLVVLNACVLLFAMPLPSWVAVMTSMLGLATLLSFLVLTIRVVLVQRGHGKRTQAAPETALPGAPGTRPGVRLGTAMSGGRAVTGIGLGAAIVAVAVVVGVGLDPAAAGITALPASSATSGTAAAAPDAGTTTVTVTMQGMRFSPDVIEVGAGERLVIDLVNADDQVHDLVLDNGATSGRLAPGEATTVEVGVVAGEMAGWCSVAGHRLMGMTLSVIPTAASPSAGPATHDHSAGEDEGASAADDIDLMAEPGSDFVARDAALAPAATDGTDAQGIASEPDPDGTGTLHRVTLEVAEVVLEVAPGITQTRWTFNGTAPGPTLRGAVGDTFVITLVNDGTIGHSIDFHAGALAPDEPMRTIDPGESLTYTFRAERSGIWMYHCSTMPMSMHIANGMAGAVVIDPPELSPVDREYLIVQSELYLGPQGEVADAEAIATQNPDLVVFNGYANQYRYAPLPVSTGERVRVWLLDVGPNTPSAFHVVGGQFDTVFSEGAYLLRDGGDDGTGGAQALALQPAQGGFVELTFPEAGHYSGVSHIMSDAEKGAAATFEVTDP